MHMTSAFSYEDDEDKYGSHPFVEARHAVCSCKWYNLAILA